MKVEITLYDKDSDEILLVSSCSDPEYVIISICGTESAPVNIEDLKLALRKICVK